MWGGLAEKVLDVTDRWVKLPGAVSVVCVSFAVLGYVATALTAVEPLWLATVVGLPVFLAHQDPQSKLALSKT